MLFPLLIVATIINQMAFKGSKVLISLFAIELGADPFIIGILISLYSLLPVLIAVHVGRLSDRIGPRLPMFAGSVGLAAGLFLPFLAPRLATLYLSAAMIGLFYIFFQVSLQHLIGSLGSGMERTRNYSLYSLTIAVGTLLGPTLAGFSIDLAGYRLTYLFLCLPPLIPAAILVGLGGGMSHAPEAGCHGKRPMMDLLRNVPLRRALITAGIVETGLELYNFYMPIYGHSLGLSASMIGIIMGAFAAGVLLMRSLIPMMVRGSSEEEAMFGSLVLAAVAFVLFPFTANPYLLMAISFMLGLGLGCCTPLLMIITYNRAPDGRNGEAMGLRQTANKFIQVLLPLAVGSLGSAFGIGPAFWLDALVLAAGSLIMRTDALSRRQGRQEAAAEKGR